MNRILFCILIVISVSSIASEVGDLINFSANTPAVASQVNDNFSSLKTGVNDNDSRIDDLTAVVMSLQTSMSNLQSELTAAEAINNEQQIQINQLVNTLIVVQNNSVLALDGYLSLETINGYETAEFSGINVMVNNGTGSTSGSVDGLGNLIVGYNEDTGDALSFCSEEQYNLELECTDNNGIWQDYVTTGSHNLIVGSNQSYTNYGSFVAGNRNVAQGRYSSVSGGSENRAASTNSSVSGGRSNIALRIYSSVSGGGGNLAAENYSSISGGRDNEASGLYSSVSGGSDNYASNSYSSVSGGNGNNASGIFSSVLGGRVNISSGDYSSISGGQGGSASGNYSSVSGGESNRARGDHSSVSGGEIRIVSGEHDWRAGSLIEGN